MIIDHTIKGWKLFYGDNTTYDSRDGEWSDAPDTGVQVLIVYENGTDNMGRNMRVVFQGDDSYYKNGDTFGSYSDGEGDEPTAKAGALIDIEDFANISNTALADYDI